MSGHRIVVTGGGTGGHIMPALAVAEALKQFDSGVELLYIGGSSGMESEIVPQTGITFQAVTSSKLRKVISLSTIKVMASLLRGCREAITYLKAFRTEALVATGGYAAGAAALAAIRLKIPVLIHEGNFIAGRTNRFIARGAQRVAVTFEETISQFSPGKGVHTGLPLRSGIVLPELVTRERARAEFRGMAAEPFTLLVIGGSQGAKALNRLVLEAAPTLTETGIQLIHQTGPNNFEEIEMLARQQGLLNSGCYLPLGFLDTRQIPLAMRAADLIVCRGGISTLAEALVNSLPMAVVPLPTAYADHQTANARALERHSAALTLPQAELTGAKLAQTILGLRDDPARLARMGAACRTQAIPDAADRVAKLTLDLIKK